MKKWIRKICIIGLIILLFFVGALVADKHTLHTQILRLHIVANSDSTEDQSAKLAVRDSVTAFLTEELQDISDCDEAKKNIFENLPKIRLVAVNTLQRIGRTDKVTVSLSEEFFDIRKYDTFSLPSGIYQSLRISIGNGEGKNWWCVVFPAFCKPVSAECFEQTAVENGMHRDLAASLSNDQGIHYRFYILDFIGKVENFFNTYC